MSEPIAVVGMACRYPDARTPEELWENVLARRKAFRRMPAERLSLADYFAPEDGPPDSIYASEAAVIEGYEFDRARFAVPARTFESADLTHWLALDVAEEAARRAGFPGGDGLPRERTGVLVGNTLTGEFARAALLRLRWPYVRRVVSSLLQDRGWADVDQRELLAELEARYKAPFAATDEETLAGGLSNTIAGRICNHLRFGGGGYTVDGACCSSLLAVAQACVALDTGDLDAAVAGGVDLSLDPFELVGFSRAGALARGPMLVYDRGSTGFLPGEGCGFVALMREGDAHARGLTIHARIRGWGIASDGGGSIMRPEPAGQRLALQRAYHHAGYAIETVALFEGHGTGTPVGDEIELGALTEALRAAGSRSPPPAIGSIKANIGHTKAAAGVAGLIKTVRALDSRVIPPATGVPHPRPELQGPTSALRVADEAETWPASYPLRAGISSFGFGGINVHLTLDARRDGRRGGLKPRERVLSQSEQDFELLLFDADDPRDLRTLVGTVADRALGLSRAELGDLAAALVGRVDGRRWRAAVVAESPRQLEERLQRLQRALAAGAEGPVEPAEGVFVGEGKHAPRVAFVFPGQASPVRSDGGGLARRFERVRALYQGVALEPSQERQASTAGVQPAIVASCLAGLCYLDDLGVRATVACGHSLGELVAYTWAGALEADALMKLARARGRLMAERAVPGVMATIATDEEHAREIVDAIPGVTIACLNARWQTVVSGTLAGVQAAVGRAAQRGLEAAMLPTSGAFHSPLMADAADGFWQIVREWTFQPMRRPVLSTITGARLTEGDDVPALLRHQLTAPVRFTEAACRLDQEADLCIEVGPGHVLTALLRRGSALPVFSVDAGAASLEAPLIVAGAAFAAGVPLRVAALTDGRFTRPFDLARRPRFFRNPCEHTPDAGASPPVVPAPCRATAEAGPGRPAATPLEAVRALIAERAQLPIEAVRAEGRLRSDYHLSSLAVAELLGAAARRFGVAGPADPLALADATVTEVARSLESLRAAGVTATAEGPAPGLEPWTRCFSVEWKEQPPPRPQPRGGSRGWQVLGHPAAPVAESLRRRVVAWPGRGVVVALPPDLTAAVGDLLLEGYRRLPGPGSERRFVVVDPAGIAGAFVRTLIAEEPDVVGCVVQPATDEDLVERVEREALATPVFTEAHYDCDGRRWERCLSPLELDESPVGLPLGPDDVVLVSGGARGIAAECARAVARETGAALALIGRSTPESALDVAAHLAGLAGESVRYGYEAADVSDPDAIGRAVALLQAELGPINAVIHAAGVNEPRLLRNLRPAHLADTLAPKVTGLRNLLHVVDPDRMRLLLTFGSVIGRFGLQGEAHYALANALLTAEAARWGRSHPGCRTLCLEWSAWSAMGMADRLGTLEVLRRDGVTPIPPAEGVATFRRLLGTATPAAPLVVSGRLGARPPVPLVGPPLPFLRFLERPRVQYAGIELVVEAEVSAETDPYLRDHALEGKPLLPAVMGLEAMAQVAQALEGSDEPPCFEEVVFDRAVLVPDGERTTLRLAALRRTRGQVDVVLRSMHTGFQVDHFRVRCRFGAGREPDVEPAPSSPPLGLDPDRDLYDHLFFQRGRFRRVGAYRELRAGGCRVDIRPAVSGTWFGPELPPVLVLGDAAARDAALHAVQACVPHHQLLPVGADRVWAGRLPASEPLTVQARERWQHADTYCYDVEIRGADGSSRERWEGLRFRRIGPLACERPPEALIVPILEWGLRAIVPEGGARIALLRDEDRRRGTERAISTALGRSARVRWRPDGRPEVAGGPAVSAAHAEDLTLAVAGAPPLACDLQFVPDGLRSRWADVLRAERLRLADETAREAGEGPDVAATRVWTALECLKKAADTNGRPLLLRSAGGGLVTFSSGAVAVVTLATGLAGRAGELVLAVLMEVDTCAHTSTGTALDSRTRVSPAMSTSRTT